MSKKTIIILCTVLVLLIGVGITLYFLLSAGGPYTGVVLESGTNLPLENVRVTDGRNVVKTDAQGNFELKGYRKTRFITVTTPAGYTTEQYYIPADKNTKSYDFHLEKSEATAAAAHSFLQVSDTEIGEKGVGEWINSVKALADELKPAFLIHTGDICYEAGLKRHITDMNTENMGVPVRYVIGNHDYVDGDYGEALFESIYGPVWYSFDVGNVHYVVTPFQTGADKKSGYNKNDRWRWLENDLANTDPDMKVVMFNHTTAPDENYVIEFDRKTLDLKEHNLIAWVFGHYHYNYVENHDGVLNISTARPDCGGIDQSASGTRHIVIDENGTVSTKMHYYNFDKSQTVSPQNMLWETTVAGNVLFCDTLYANEKVYTATADDDWPRSCGIYCLNAEDGRTLWTFKTENSVKNNLVLADGRLLAQDCEGNVYCLNADNGTVLWQRKVSLGNSLGTSAGICTDGTLVFTGCAAGITALNLDSGEIAWENIRNKGECSAAEFVLAGDKLLVNAHWNALVALDKSTGKQLWENKDEDIRFRSSTPAVLDESTLLVADDDAIMLVDCNTGEIKHKTTFDEYTFSSSARPVVDGSTAYIATADKGLIAYDLTAHTVVWNTQTKQNLVHTAPYINGDSKTIEPTPLLKNSTLLFGASDGYFYKADAADGRILQEYNLGAPVFGTVAEADGKLYAADFSGRILCLTD